MVPAKVTILPALRPDSVIVLFVGTAMSFNVMLVHAATAGAI